MSNSRLLVSSVIMYLLFSNVNSHILSNGVMLRGSENNDPEEVDLVRIQVAPRPRNFITNLLLSHGVREVMWYFLKFVVCNIVTVPMACGVMNVLGDEVEDGASLRTPEDIARGLRFIEDIIEMYHSAQKRAL